MNQSNRTNIELFANIHDARNSLNYTLHGDYYLPDITAESGKPLGKYGRARLRYLKEHRSNIYTRLLFTGKLFDDLNETDYEAEHLLKTLMIAADLGAPRSGKNILFHCFSPLTNPG